MRRALMSIAVLLFLVTAGCFDTTQQFDGPASPGIDGRVVGFIHGIVYDYADNTRLQNVLVTVVVQGAIRTTRTNSMGYYAFATMPSGEYELTFSDAAGFAVLRVYADVPDLDDVGIDWDFTHADFNYSLTRDAYLFGLTSGVTGTVYTEMDRAVRTPAAGVTVLADLGDYGGYDISPHVYTAITDSSGMYSFENLPAVPDEVQLRNQPFNDGMYDFDVDVEYVDLLPHTVSMADPLILEITGVDPIVVSENFMDGEFLVDASLELVFSKAMDPNTFDYRLRQGGSLDVALVPTWSSDNISLTLDPVVTLLPGAEYRLELEGMSMDANDFDFDEYFYTQPGIDYLWTNVERLPGYFDEFPLDGNIELYFSLAVDLDHIEGWVYLYDASNAEVAADISVSTDGMTIIIDPDADLVASSEYRVDCRAYSGLPEDFANVRFNNNSQTFTTAAE